MSELASESLSPASDRTLVATDGSCLRNPGGATGWAYVREDGAWAYGGGPVGTNQIGELMAVVIALTDHRAEPLEIQSDSAYAIGCATTWKAGWQRNNYINSQRKQVSNLDIVRSLHHLLDTRTAPVVFTKVKGHDLSNRWPLNTAVDQVCGWAALAAQKAGGPVTGTGVLEINWVQRVPRRSALA
jgi:ribonuclease HI